ncbi:MAG: hypothetical protein JWO06_914 [Bacteroidota bacterium]|nr:hypothetical protein [Bacteroidota bacterium]
MSAASSFIYASPQANKSNNIIITDSLPQKNAGGTVDSLLKTSDSTHVVDSFTVVTDTIHKNDTVSADDQGDIKDIIKYSADDSIVYDMSTKKMFLYNKVDMKYQKITLTANRVDFDWTTFTMGARGTPDSSGKASGNPVFSDDGKEFKADSMLYNFKTKKGLVYHVITKEGEAYLHTEIAKKNEFDEMYGQGAEYTTCDLEHPHFYFKAKKVKIVPDKVMVTGPLNLWIGDVPTPIYLPFAIIPVKQGKRSGIVIPEYGSDPVLGFFLRNGGYYWGVNDYVGMKFTGMISTNGTYGIGVNTQYALRYKFNGSLAFSYTRSRPQDPDVPDAKLQNSNAFSLNWTHTQDPRSLPNSTFGANVAIQSSNFYNVNRVTDTRLLTPALSSTVNFSQAFPGTPLSLSVNLRHAQNLTNGTIDFTMPTFRLSMSRVSPFKSKIKSDKPKWFESIGMTYSFEFQNHLSTYDSLLTRAETLKQFNFGFNQSFTIDAPIRVFKYFNLTPSFSYQERTYFKGTNDSWDPDTVFVINGGYIDTVRGRIKSDTVWRFNSSRTFTASLAFGTKVIGIYKFKGEGLKAIKHVFTPTIALNYNPDFSSPMWGYYGSVQSDALGHVVRYSRLDPGAIYGVPGPGRVGSLTWNLANNLEMKTYSKKDSVNHEKKLGLLDQVGLSGGYNFAADSMRLQPFNLTIVSARLFNLINLNFNSVFDPYATDSFNNRINTFEWTKQHKLLRFAQANISASIALHSKPKPVAANAEPLPKYVGDYVSYSPDQIYHFDIPWNISVNYNFNISRGTYLNPDTIIKIQSLSLRADFNLTPHWKVAVSTGFDISRRQLTLTNVTVIRDLHCWELTFNWSPLLQNTIGGQFSIILQPKSATLKDLKVQKKSGLGGLGGVGGSSGQLY